MVKKAILVTILSVAVAGCAHGARMAASATEPSASIPSASAMAGEWKGAVWETAASYSQGSSPVDIRVADDGTWQGTIGKSAAAGTTTLRNGKLVLAGTSTAHDGRSSQPVYYVLKGDSMRRWGPVVSAFPGRDAAAEMSLQKVQ